MTDTHTQLAQPDLLPLTSGRRVDIYQFDRTLVPRLYDVLMEPATRDRWRSRGRHLSPAQFEAFVMQHMVCSGAIVRRSTGDIIGLVELLEFAPLDRRGQVSIALNRSYWGTGLGIDAGRAFTRHLFDAFPIDKLAMQVDMSNPAFRNALDGPTMTLEGVLRRHLNVRGQWRDVGLYAMWRDDFRSVDSPAAT